MRSERVYTNRIETLKAEALALAHLATHSGEKTLADIALDVSQQMGRLKPLTASERAKCGDEATRALDYVREKLSFK